MEENVLNPAVEEPLCIPKETARLLMDIAKWTKFISIVGLVTLGLYAVLMIACVFLLSGVNEYTEALAMYEYAQAIFSWIYLAVFLFILLVYFLPVIYLYKFSKHIKIAVETNNIYELNQSFQFLKDHYAIIGILIIIGLSLFVLMFLFLIMVILLLI